MAQFQNDELEYVVDDYFDIADFLDTDAFAGNQLRGSHGADSDFDDDEDFAEIAALARQRLILRQLSFHSDRNLQPCLWSQMDQEKSVQNVGGVYIVQATKFLLLIHRSSPSKNQDPEEKVEAVVHVLDPHQQHKPPAERLCLNDLRSCRQKSATRETMVFGQGIGASLDHYCYAGHMVNFYKERNFSQWCVFVDT